MYEGVAVLLETEGGIARIAILAHNITDQKLTNTLMQTVAIEYNREASPFTHTLYHEGDPTTCDACLAAIQEKIKIVKEDRRAARGGDSEAFEDPTARPLLVDHTTIQDPKA